MAIASINFQSAGANSEKHMDRESKVTYLLEPDSKKNEYKTFKSAKDYLSAAKVVAKEKTGRSMQKLAEKNFIQEAVVNLESRHTLEDVKNTFDNLKEEFGGFEVFKIAVHKDEGYFYHKSEDLEYRPNKDIFFNENDKKFYLDKNYSKEADLSQFEKRYNYHAHVLFTKFNINKGKNCRLNKKDMRDIQTIVANSLGMERGKINSQAKRMTHYQLKDLHDKSRQSKVNTLEKYNFRDMQKKITSLENASVEDKKQLHKLNSQVKNSKATIQELNSKIYKLISENVDIDFLQDNIKKLEQDKISDKKLINDLQEQNNEKDEQILTLEEKINSTPNLEDLRAYTEQKLNTKFTKTPTIPVFFNYFIKKIKDLIIKIKELTTENMELKEENTDLKIKIINLETDIELSGDERTLEEIASNLDEEQEYKLNTVPNFRQR